MPAAAVVSVLQVTGSSLGMSPSRSVHLLLNAVQAEPIGGWASPVVKCEPVITLSG
jgi:hypothetical protein